MTRHCLPQPLVPLDTSAPGPPKALSTAERLQTLDPQRRRLFAQRLAILIQRLRAAPPVLPMEDIAHEP